jgi:hypothetical protein
MEFPDELIAIILLRAMPRRLGWKRQCWQASRLASLSSKWQALLWESVEAIDHKFFLDSWTDKQWLSRLTGLREIDTPGLNVQITRLTRLHTLNISGGDAHFSIECFSELRVLKLWGNWIDRHLGPPPSCVETVHFYTSSAHCPLDLLALPRLRNLELGECEIPLGTLLQLTRLEHLDLGAFNPVTAEDLLQFPLLTSLASLDDSLSDDELPLFTHLRALDVREADEITDQGLLSMTQLRELSCDDYIVHSNTLAQLTLLERLCIDSARRDSGNNFRLYDLTTLVNLTHLRLEEPHWLGVIDLPEARSWPRLRTIVVERPWYIMTAEARLYFEKTGVRIKCPEEEACKFPV